MTGWPVTERVAGHRGLAIIDPAGPCRYEELDRSARAVAGQLLGGRADLDGARVALLADAGRDFVVALLACWHAGGVAVPLHPPLPDAELAYVLADADVTAVVCSLSHLARAPTLVASNAVPVIDVAAASRAGAGATVTVDAARPALMIHTSGTTGRPKGVVHTHGSIVAQVDTLLEAWAWRADDRIVLVLPLNHVHGVMAVTLCALAAGAVCEAPGRFDAAAIWSRFASGDVTLFMAVPTIYARLVAAWEQADGATREAWSAGARRLRLMVSGSAALPVSTLERWRELTGQVLLERYGMTELGMALSNRLDRREPGFGWPLPGVEMRLVDEAGGDVAEGGQGELLVRGPNVFREYWRRPEATAEAFVDGWFRTGDVAVVEPEGVRLLGRSSVDIIKSGGEKVSALEIEEVFRAHPAVADLAVVGIADDEWGERVCAAVVLAPGATDGAESLRAWGKGRLAPAKVPVRYALVDELPRNALGKVVKPRVAELFTRDPTP